MANIRLIAGGTAAALVAGGAVVLGANTGGAEGAPDDPVHCGKEFSFQIGQDGLNSQTFLVESEMDPKKGEDHNSERATGWIAVRVGALEGQKGVEVRTSDPQTSIEAARKQLNSEEAGMRDEDHLQAVLAGENADSINGQAILTPATTAEVDGLNILVTGGVDDPTVGVNVVCADN